MRVSCLLVLKLAVNFRMPHSVWRVLDIISSLKLSNIGRSARQAHCCLTYINSNLYRTIGTHSCPISNTRLAPIVPRCPNIDSQCNKSVFKSPLFPKAVPQDFNIFTLLGIPVPEGGPEGWRIVMKNDSVAYAKVSTIFKVSHATGSCSGIRRGKNRIVGF